MFQISSNVLQSVVSKMVKAAKRARLASGHIHVNTNKKEQTVTFSFAGTTLSVVKTIEAKVTSDSTFTATFSEFQSKISPLPVETKLTLEFTSTNNISIKWGSSSRILMFTVPTTEINFNVPEIKESFSLPAGKIHFYSRNIATFCALDNSKIKEKYPVSVGVRFSKDTSGQLVLQASTGYRSIRCTEKDISWFDTSISIHSEIINATAELIEEDQDISISLATNNNTIVITCSGVTVVARLLDGDFPDYSSKFSNENANHVCRVDRLDLLETTRRVKQLCTDKTKPYIHFSVEGKKIFAVHSDVIKEQVAALFENSSKEDFALDFNNLEAALTVLRTEEVLIAFSEKLKPLTLFSGDEKESDNLVVLVGQVDLTK